METQSYSWTKRDNNTVVKKMDKSAFLHHGSAIPKNLKGFWGVENYAHGDRQQVILLFEGRKHKGRIEIDTILRARIFWDSALNSTIHKLFPNNTKYKQPDYPEMAFQKMDNLYYEVTFRQNLTDVDLIDDIEIEERNIQTTSIGKNEGEKKLYYVTKFERNPQNRKQCIKHHGCRCSVCGFDFKERYGEWGENFIEVHHLIPLHTLDNETTVNPIDDLIPICPNCHRMLHRKRDTVLTPSQLRELLK